MSTVEKKKKKKRRGQVCSRIEDCSLQAKSVSKCSLTSLFSFINKDRGNYSQLKQKREEDKKIFSRYMIYNLAV